MLTGMPTVAISVTGAAISLASAIFAYWRVSVTYHQIRTQNLLQVFNYLHQKELRDARHAVRTAPRGQIDLDQLRMVCSSFDFAGLFIANNLIKKEIFNEYWNELFFFFKSHLSGIKDETCFGDVSWGNYYPFFFNMVASATLPKRM